MKLLYALVLIACFSLPANTLAQEAKPASEGIEMNIKFYAQFLRLNAPTFPYFEKQSFSLLDYLSFKPSFTFLVRKNAVLHEIEPTFRFREYESDGLKETYISLRYEIGKLDPRQEDKKLYFHMGLSSELYYYNGEGLAGTVFILRKEFNKFGLILSSVPHLHLKLNDKLHLDLNMALMSLGYVYIEDYTDNPAFTESQKTITKTEFELAIARSFRIGLGFSF